jgi:hypothetical protein
VIGVCCSTVESLCTFVRIQHIIFGYLFYAQALEMVSLLHMATESTVVHATNHTPSLLAPDKSNVIYEWMITHVS